MSLINPENYESQIKGERPKLIASILLAAIEAMGAGLKECPEVLRMMADDIEAALRVRPDLDDLSMPCQCVKCTARNN